MRGWRTPFDPLPTPAELLLRLALASALVLGLANVFASSLLAAGVPAVRAAFGILDHDFVVLGMETAENAGHHVIRLRADLARPTYVNGYRLAPLGDRGWYEVHITSGAALQGAVVTLIAVLAWPARSIRRLLLRTLIALPLVAIFAIFDTAIMLLGDLWTPLVRHWNPGGVSASLIGSQLLDGGGRFAFAFLLAACIVACLRDRTLPAQETAA